MDGLEATRAIRGLRGPEADVPIIALTANAYGEDIENCRAAGMTDFLAKPARKQDLIDAIVRATNTTAHGSEPKETSAASPTPRSVSFDAAALFDREVFNDFATSVGADAANEVIAVFVRDAETRLKTLQELSCASDRERIRSEAHSLKGEAATLGLLALSRLARALEQGAPTIDAEEYRNIVGSLDSTFELSRPHLPGPMTASDGGGRALRA